MKLFNRRLFFSSSVLSLTHSLLFSAVGFILISSFENRTHENDYSNKKSIVILMVFLSFSLRSCVSYSHFNATFSNCSFTCFFHFTFCFGFASKQITKSIRNGRIIIEISLLLKALSWSCSTFQFVDCNRQQTRNQFNKKRQTKIEENSSPKGDKMINNDINKVNTEPTATATKLCQRFSRVCAQYSSSFDVSSVVSPIFSFFCSCLLQLWRTRRLVNIFSTGAMAMLMTETTSVFGDGSR